MLLKLRRSLTWANVAMTLALVFAMSGGAYAAKRYLITSTGQISPKVLKALAGKPGKPGPAGPEGKQGPAGPAGPAGKDGANGLAGAAGKDGTNGTNGANGTSATTESFSGEAHGCEAGGVIVKSASPDAPVCNGQTGFTATLPAEKTETGTWSAAGSYKGYIAGSISFPIPLGGPLDASHVHFVDSTGKEQAVFIFEPSVPRFEWVAEATSACPGNSAEPAATPGNLCVYQGNDQSVVSLGKELQEGAIAPPNSSTPTFAIAPGAGASGAVVSVQAEEGKEEVFAWGSWAVTAE